MTDRGRPQSDHDARIERLRRIWRGPERQRPIFRGVTMDGILYSACGLLIVCIVVMAISWLMAGPDGRREAPLHDPETCEACKAQAATNRKAPANAPRPKDSEGEQLSPPMFGR